ncbi:MULE domain-containing protein, partial [Aphis craccivora]
PHPNIFNFIDELLEVQSETTIKLRSKKQKNKRTLDKEENLREQMTKYTGNVITRFEFIKSISMKFLPST